MKGNGSAGGQRARGIDQHRRKETECGSVFILKNTATAFQIHELVQMNKFVYYVHELNCNIVMYDELIIIRYLLCLLGLPFKFLVGPM